MDKALRLRSLSFTTPEKKGVLSLSLWRSVCKLDSSSLSEETFVAGTARMGCLRRKVAKRADSSIAEPALARWKAAVRTYRGAFVYNRCKDPFTMQRSLDASHLHRVLARGGREGGISSSTYARTSQQVPWYWSFVNE